MRRRLFLSGSAAATLALTGCGGGGGGAGVGAADAGAVGAESPAGATPSLYAATPAGTSYPFGARLDRYVAGIRPSQSASAMDALLTAQYDAWKAARVVTADSIVAGGYAVQFSNASYITVSEGMGYGMLIAVLFAGHDPKAQALFDGLLSVVRARPAYEMVPYDPGAKYLMDWRINANGSAGDGWNAIDGDLDIAMALLMANRQWGSAGKWNYLQEARNTIGAIKTSNMKPNGATKGLRSAANNRSSDYMIGHFRAFQAATGDELWQRAVDKAYRLLDRMQTVYSPSAGLIPDFVMNTDDDSAAMPSTGYIGDGNDKEGYFWWNACRNPWRFASDYVLSGDNRFASVTGKMIDFFKSSSGGDPVNIGTGYALDGTQLTGGNSAAYHGPICAGACVDSRFQGFLDTMWGWNAKHLTTGYYDGEIQLLSMAVASGNWWSPAKNA